MLRFNALGFPVEIQWPFWLTAVLLSGRMEASTTFGFHALLEWVAVVFVSILVHELGHALAMKHFGDRGPRITLYAMGGLAHPTSWFSRHQSMIVSAAGPAASLALGLLGWLVERAFPPEFGSIAWLMLQDWMRVNFGWTIFNLLPIMPLDGGQIAEAYCSKKAAWRPIAMWLSFIFAAAAALYMLVIQQSVFNTLFFGMLAYSSWQRLQGLPHQDFRDFGG